MYTPASRRLVAALFSTAVALGGLVPSARAQGASPPQPHPQLPQPAHKAPPAPPPRAAPAATHAAQNDPYRCHPAEDIACTVVRETSQGMVIVTLRQPRAVQPAVWSVISGTPPGTPTLQPGGTVYVVPTVRMPSEPGAIPTANGAPILD